MLKEAANKGRLAQLYALRDILADAIDAKPGARDLAGLARQFRDTAKEIAELEDMDVEDEITAIIADQC